MHALRVAHSDALWNTADSHGISNEVDKIGRRGRGDHEIGMRVSRPSLKTERYNLARRAKPLQDAILDDGEIRREQLEKNEIDLWETSGTN